LIKQRLTLQNIFIRFHTQLYYQTTNANTLTLPQTFQFTQPNLLLTAPNGSLLNTNQLGSTQIPNGTLNTNPTTATTALFDFAYNTQLNGAVLNASSNRASQFQDPTTTLLNQQHNNNQAVNRAAALNSFLQLNAALNQSNNTQLTPAANVTTNPVIINSLFTSAAATGVPNPDQFN
jgi:hypothetical protein